MGVRVLDLSGNWKDELGSLEKGMVALEQKRNSFKSDGNTKKTYHYTVGTGIDNDKLCSIRHQPVTSAAAGKPITIKLQVTAPAGVKWVRLRYRNVNQEQEYQTLPMVATSEKDSYEVTVPADQINPTWDFMYYLQIMIIKAMEQFTRI